MRLRRRRHTADPVSALSRAVTVHATRTIAHWAANIRRVRHINPPTPRWRPGYRSGSHGAGQRGTTVQNNGLAGHPGRVTGEQERDGPRDVIRDAKPLERIPLGHLFLAALVQSLGKVRLRSEEHTSELQSRQYLVCRLL